MSTPPSESLPFLDPRTYEDRQRLRAWAFQQALRVASSTETDMADILADAESIFNYVANEPDEFIPHPSERRKIAISTPGGSPVGTYGSGGVSPSPYYPTRSVSTQNIRVTPNSLS